MKHKQIVSILVGGIALLLMAIFVQAQALEPQVVRLPFVLKGYPLAQSGEIVFASNRDGDAEIFRMDYDGGDLVQLTDNVFTDTSPDWAPDASKIAFISDQMDDDEEIYVMDPDGANVVRLTTIGNCENPRWSPDGLHIAFASDHFGYVLYTMDPDGKNLLPLTQTISDIQDLSWSPDSQQIAFSTYFTSPAGVYVVDADGGEAELVFEHGFVNGIAWSPDGRWLAMNIMSQTTFTHDLYLYDLENETLTRLTDTTLNHFSPKWFPLGQYLVFQAYLADGMTSYIYTMPVKGTQPIQISDGGSDYAPDWTQ